MVLLLWQLYWAPSYRVPLSLAFAAAVAAAAVAAAAATAGVRKEVKEMLGEGGG